jgi:hypothetical protein
VSVDLKEARSFLNKLRENLCKVQLHNIVYIKGFWGKQKRLMLFTYLPSGIVRTLYTIGIQFHPSVQYLYHIWWEGRCNFVCVCAWFVVLCISVASSFVQGWGFVQNSKAVCFAYYFSFWAWLKEVRAICMTSNAVFMLLLLYL